MTDDPRPRGPKTSFDDAAAPAAHPRGGNWEKRGAGAQGLVSPFDAPGIVGFETRLAMRDVGEDRPVVTTARVAAGVLRSLIGDADREQVVALYLDGAHTLTHAHIVSTGTLTSSLVHPREVFKGALLANAAAMIVGHNHPSGKVVPSTEDQSVFERLKEAGELLGIAVIDSLIVGAGPQFYAHSLGRAEFYSDLDGPWP